MRRAADIYGVVSQLSCLLVDWLSAAYCDEVGEEQPLKLRSGYASCQTLLDFARASTCPQPHQRYLVHASVSPQATPTRSSSSGRSFLGGGGRDRCFCQLPATLLANPPPTLSFVSTFPLSYRHVRRYDFATPIAAPYRFKTIKVSRSAWPVFAFRIAAVRAQYFTMLDIDECSKATLEGFLPLFPRFPNIKTLKVHPSATQHICGNHWYPHILGDLDTQVGYARVAFVGLLARLRSLEIQSHADLLYLDAFIGRAERVRTLVLDVTNLRSPHTAIRSIAKLSSLEELEITTSASTAIDFAAASSGNVRYPPLQSLTVRGEHLMDDFFDFAALFTGSLTTLVIEMQLAASDEPSDYAQPRELTFPALTDLRLTGCAKLILPLFYSFTADHYPALTTVYLYLNATPELDDADLVTVLQGHVESPRRHFKTLHIFDLACPFYPEEIRYLTSWAATNRVDLVHTPTRIYPETPLVVADPLRNLRNGEMAEQPLVSAVDQTMDFLVQWHGRAKQGQDGDGYSKLATMLRRAELERVAMAT